MALRYARKDRRVYEYSYCKVCGAAGGCPSSGCTTAVCAWCETPQCSANGLGRGQCSICSHGFLSGWSHGGNNGPCAYKNCAQPVVGHFPRKGRACAEHGARILGADYLAKRLAEREKFWVALEV